jgi:hypothetical protein
MGAYRYEAVDALGKPRRGVLDADTPRQVRDRLRGDGLFPTAIEPASAAGATAEGTRPASRLRLPATTVALLTRQLATLVQSGMPLDQALAALAEQADDARAAAIATGLRTRVGEGEPLAGAMAGWPRTFGPLYRGLVAVGGETGRLDDVLARLADYLEAREAQKQKFTLALVYPVLVTIVALAVVAVLLAYDSKPGRGDYQRPNTIKSPISAAKPNRPELNDLNKRQARPMPADVKRPSADANAKNWKGQSGYAGAKDRDKMSSQERIANAQPGYSKPVAKPATGKAGSRELPKAQPKVQGSYAGAKPDRPQTANAGKPGSRELPKANAKPANAKPMPTSRPTPTTKNVQRPSSGQVDRGYDKSPANAKPAARPQQVDRPKPANAKPMPTSRPTPSSGNRGTAMSGSNSGKSQKAASQRGKQSMPQGARSKGGGGGGKKKQR